MLVVLGIIVVIVALLLLILHIVKRTNPAPPVENEGGF